MADRQRQVLVVDDEPVSLDALRQILAPDYGLVFARNGAEALAGARKHLPSLVLLDISLPDLDGYAVCRALKADPATRDIPVIFVTGLAGVGQEEEGFNAGAVDYITKPITAAIVRARVRTQLDIKRARDWLRDENAVLEAAVAKRVEELRASQQKLRELAAHQMVLKEAERKRIAQEIHDELGQRLTVLRMDIAMLPRAVGADPAGLLPAQVAGLKKTVDGIVAVVRDIAGQLRPATLDVGLATAAEGLVEEFAAHAGLACAFDNRLPPGFAVDDTRATAAFRILQESLTNVARHARASRVRVTLAATAEALHLQVRDDGHGIDPARGRHRPTFGLSGMRERADLLGGSVGITSEPGRGTTVDARIPLAGGAVDEPHAGGADR